MKTYRRLWPTFCSKEHLWHPYQCARRHKTSNPAVQAFDKHAAFHLALLRHELLTRAYRPHPLTSFVLRDPKTRIISKSNFRDRVIHHALVTILQPIYEPRFIHHSYASRKGKGTLAAVRAFECFVRKVTRNGQRIPNARNNNDVIGYALKCDIKHYFDTVHHHTLKTIIRRHVNDEGVLSLVGTILDNHHTTTTGTGMPLGNWTSQFFANVYLNELDQYVKHTLKAPYYVRYVDDFVILDTDPDRLRSYQEAIAASLQSLHLDLHPNKCHIIALRRGVPFLACRIFCHHKLVRRRNLRHLRRRLATLISEYHDGTIGHETVTTTLQGWNAYAANANTYGLRQHLEWRVTNALAGATRPPANDATQE